ncbi:hypothetical protein AURDEDRAFT_164231 [Auricularia subglabra TFB-10046 SS5]|nr:hypothetical protein AURDEDRAFT_164231 [Auricularia subglabra TFB-10046 SS5]
MSQSSHDDRARWLDVIAPFKSEIITMTRASDVETAQQRVMDTAQRLMHELIFDWNRSSVICRLPPEILATCFSFLDLEELFEASHVCRAWRSTALSCPSLWSTVHFVPSRFTDPEAVDLILKRSGQTLLELYFICGNDNEELLGPILEPHMHRIRHLAWTAGPSELFLRQAPMLESLICDQLSPIPENLFGGCRGRLRTLEVFSMLLPEKCPALSTLTSLSAYLAGYQEEAQSLVHLFLLCPLLEHLEFGEMTQAHYPFLSAGSPTRLQTLTLYSAAENLCDLTRYVSAWAPANPNLSQIRLSVHYECILSHSAYIFEATETLSISQHVGYARIQTTDIHGRSCTLSLRHPVHFSHEKISLKLANIIRQHGALLGQLRVLSAPVAVLSRLFNLAPAMPALSVLVEAWKPENSILWDYVSPAAQLSCLAQTGHLQLLRIDIVALVADGVAHYEGDVENVLAALATSLPARDQGYDVEVVVQGLKGKLTSDELPSVTGYRIVLGGDEGDRRSTFDVPVHRPPAWGYDVPKMSFSVLGYLAA